jgi:multidrug efflux pump
VLDYQAFTMLVAVAVMVLTVALYIIVPKGFFPTQDTGIIQGITQTAASTSFKSMAQKQQDVVQVVLSDPAVAGVSSFIGPDGTNTTLNSGRIEIDLKQLEERRISATEVIRRLSAKLAGVPGIRLYMQPVQDLTVDDRVTRTQYQYTLEDPNQNVLNEVVHDLVAKLKRLPQLADVATDQQLGGLAQRLVIDRPTASRFGITPQNIANTLYDAFGQRQVNTLYTDVNQYHVVLETEPEFRVSPERLNDIYIQSTVSKGTVPPAAGGPVSNTAGSSSGAGAGVAPAVGNALLAPSSTTGIPPPAATTPALTASNVTTPLAAFNVNATSPLAAPATAATAATPLSVVANSTAAGVGSIGATGASRTGAAAQSSQGTQGGGGGPASSAAPIATPVPLRAFAQIHTESESLSVNRQGQFPAVTISFNLGAGYSLGQAVSAMNGVLSQTKFPASVVGGFQGTAEAFENSQTNQALLILAALVVVYIVLGVLYESFVHPVTILSTLPSAGLGALLALLLFHLDLDIVAIIGIILLIGIVKKNGIMMVDFALEAERTEGRTPADAIYQASLLRFRPILMTTMAALLSGVPLAFGTGIGSELRRPLGAVMIGGLLVSQVLTLYTTPVIYVFFANLGGWFARRRRRRA